MRKLANHWEKPFSAVIPYLQWTELNDGATDTWDTGRHNHAAYELHIILTGHCTLSINSTEVTLQAGQGILIAPEVFHAPAMISQPFFRFSATFFPGDGQLAGLVPEKGSFATFLVSDSIKTLCSAVLAEIRNEGGLFHKEMLSSQFSLILLQVFRTIKENAFAYGESVSNAKQLEDMTVIDRFFVTTPPKLRTKENLAQLLHCSQRQVLRKIYALYGMSFQEKLMISRIDTAQHLLRVTDKSIEEICMLVGYAGTAAFYKAFKRYADSTPIKYRKQATAAAESVGSC